MRETMDDHTKSVLIMGSAPALLEKFRVGLEN